MSYNISKVHQILVFSIQNQDMSLIGYADARYLSDLHNGKSQSGLVFLYGGTVIS
jgi:hypothetical protein